MSTKEQLTYRIIEDFRQGKISRKESATILGISERSVTRKAKSIREKGMSGVKHQNLGSIPVNKICDEVKKQFLDLMKNKYYDFNIVHALEMLLKYEQLEISYSSAYRWCRKAGIGKLLKNKRRSSKARVRRERMANEGLMLQLDGSHHEWNGKDKWCLIALIDDATSDIPYGELFEAETTFGCMKVLKSVIELKGIPDIIYTDFAGWSGNGKRSNFSHFKTACEELGIRVISTSSPESKGRIERAWKTFQDRLIPEMRLHGVTSMKGANQYLQQSFLPNYWSKHNTVQPLSQTTRYKTIPEHINLDRVFCLKYFRHVSSNHTVTYNNIKYQVDPGVYGSLKNKQIVVHEYESHEIEFYYGHTLLMAKQIKERPRWARAS